MKLLCLVSCVFPSYFVFHGLIKCEYFSDEEFQSLGTTRSSMKDDAANGAHQGLVCSDRRPSTPRISTATLGSFREVSKNSTSNCISQQITFYCTMSVDMILLFSLVSLLYDCLSMGVSTLGYMYLQQICTVDADMYGTGILF